VSSLSRCVEGCLIAALWMVTASRRQIRHQLLIQAALLCLLATTAFVADRDAGLGPGDLPTLVLLAGLVLPTVMVHEVSHGWVAYKLGDPTAKERGRLSFNPLKHMSFKWTILFPITTYYLFRVALILPKPVPINPRNFKNPRKGIMQVGIAGPAVNILLMLFFAAILSSGLVPDEGAGALVRQLLAVLIILNMVLAMFNLIPIPPLDGSRLLIGLLPAKQAAFLIRVQILGLLFIFAVVIGAAMSVGIAQVLLPPIKFVWGLLGLDVGELEAMFAE
jgi:Zn-dependent protease